MFEEMTETRMSNTEIAAALVAYAAQEITPGELSRLFHEDNVSRSLSFAMTLFRTTAMALQMEVPNVPVKTNLMSAASTLVTIIDGE